MASVTRYRLVMILFQIISHPQRMESFTDHEYKKTMLNVMHRLSCGKNKDGITLEEEEVVNALYLNFKLNSKMAYRDFNFCVIRNNPLSDQSISL